MAHPEPQASACAALRRRTPHDTLRTRKPAYTLVELVMVIGVMSVLMFGVTSAILIASHAAPNPNDENTALRSASAVLDEISEEVRTALWFIEHETTKMTFTVPDRDNNGVPERITYNWSGTAGDPLTRQYNAGAPAVLIAQLEDLSFAYTTKSIDEVYPGPPVESAELVLDFHAGSSDLKEWKIEEEKWIAQSIEPTLPDEALSWSLTRIQLQAVRDGSNSGSSYVQIRTLNESNRPTDTVLEQVLMPESGLPSSYGVESFTFTGVRGRPSDQGLALVIEWNSGGVSAKILYDRSGSGLMTTTNGGDSWNYQDDEAMRFAAYGKYVTPGPNQTATRQYITSVGIDLQPTKDPASRITTAAPTYNMPEVLSGMWITEFDADPTIDHNGDGVGDWDTDGASFNIGQLSGGVYWADGGLYTQPASDLDELTTVELRFRDNGDEGASGGIRLRVDRTGDEYAFIEAEVNRVGTRQDLSITTWDAEVWLTESVPAGEFMTLRFVVDPGADTAYIRMNGTEMGTFTYELNTVAGKPQAVELYETALISGVEFDYVHVRVGGIGS